MTSTVVIIGSGLAGHCCAQFLVKHADRVILVDRDELPATVEARAGVPQGRHAHVVLDRGRRELERFFPGFCERMEAAGAQLVDPGLSFAQLGPSGWAPRLPTEARMLCASRDLTDATIRALRTTSDRLEVRARTEVAAVRVAGHRVVGVELKDRASGATEIVECDLLVDASGRASKLPGLLVDAGIAVPEEIVVDSGTWYSTRWFQSPTPHAATDARWWRAAILVPLPGLRGALLMPVEGDRWIVSIASVGLGQPKIDEDNFMETLRSLRSPIIADAVDAPCTPITGVYGSRSTPNRMRPYGSWEQPVGGFVAIGDAACAFNPIHGQGVTCTAVTARILETAIEEGGVKSASLPSRFFKAQQKWLAEPWGLSTGFDLKFPATPGKRKLAPKLVAPYLRLFVAAMRDDVSLLRRVAEVGQLNQPAATLMGWDSMARVFKSTVKRRIARGMGPVPPPAPLPSYPPPTISA